MYLMEEEVKFRSEQWEGVKEETVIRIPESKEALSKTFCKPQLKIPHGAMKIKDPEYHN